jgi:predicted ester cyclase
MTKKTPSLTRRELVKAGGMMGSGVGLLLLAGNSTAAQTNETHINQNHRPERTEATMLDNNSEPDLRADDRTLSSRARELIRIGEIGIARENHVAMARFFHPDFRFHGPDGNTLKREQLWNYFAACRAAFDDFSVTRQQIFSDGGNFLAARTTFSGIFARPFTASPIGTIQPNGKHIFYKINNVFRYALDETLVEEWAQYDSRLFVERLGIKLVPSN